MTTDKMPARLPEGLTIEEVMAEVEENMFGLGNTGFCLSCGADRSGCEPDARFYECYECGDRMVFGAEEVMMRYA